MNNAVWINYTVWIIYRLCFLHSPVEGHLGCFQFVVFRNKATENIHMLGFLWTCVFILLWKMLRSMIVGTYSKPILALQETVKLFQSDCTILHSPQHCMRLSIALYVF